MYVIRISRRSPLTLAPSQDQATGTKHALLSDLNVCDVVDIKDDKNDGFLFSLRINKTVHELCADTEQVRARSPLRSTEPSLRKPPRPSPRLSPPRARCIA